MVPESTNAAQKNIDNCGVLMYVWDADMLYASCYIFANGEGGMSRIENLLHKVVKDENSTTEFFCNLLNIQVLREKFLETFLPLPVVRSIKFEDVDTQSPAGGGRPDMIIEGQDVCILFEVKIEPGCALTDKQPEEYLNYLRDKKVDAKYRVLIFILPKGYIDEGDLIKRAEKDPIVSRLDRRSSALENKVQWRIIYWEEIIALITENGLDRFNVFLNEFNKLLRNWYLPQIIFKRAEVKMMFSKTIPEARKTLKKLKELVDSVEQKSKKFNPEPSHSQLEYGIYFKNAEGRQILWFGIWYECWEKMEVPIVFGVGKDETDEARKIFTEHLPQDRRKRWKDLDFGWFDQVTLVGHNAAEVRQNAAELIWNELEPLLEKMTNTS